MVQQMMAAQEAASRPLVQMKAGMMEVLLDFTLRLQNDRQ